MADDYSLPFWTQVATRFKANPLVAFDLFNEPYYLPDPIWQNGGMAYGVHVPGMQQLYNTVRATGATNLVFISGQNFAYNIDVSLRYPIDGYGIVYSTHMYLEPGTGALPPTRDATLLPVAAKYPVVIAEFGTDARTGTYNANLIAYAESHGLGWIAFSWNEPGAAGSKNYGLLGSFWTYTPSAAGAPVRAALWQARGWTTWGK
jgi:hypothetical protein